MVGKVDACLKKRLKERNKRAFNALRTKKGMLSLPATLKRCDFLITLVISSSEIDMSEGNSAGYEALGMSKRSASDIAGKNSVFKASALSEGVVAFPDRVTRLRIDGGVGGRWLLNFAHYASSHMPFLPLAALATACLKCVAFAFLIASSLALSASR
jgi:hypothetical protein